MKCFTLHVMNLKYMKVSLFEIIYKKKWTFSPESNFLRCTCASVGHVIFAACSVSTAPACGASGRVFSAQLHHSAEKDLLITHLWSDKQPHTIPCSELETLSSHTPAPVSLSLSLSRAKPGFFCWNPRRSCTRTVGRWWLCQAWSKPVIHVQNRGMRRSRRTQTQNNTEKTLGLDTLQIHEACVRAKDKEETML